MSTTGLFQAAREDGRSDWRVVFDLTETMPPGNEIGHDVLLKALQTKDRNRMYRAVGRANRELWATRSRSLASVKGRGYRMLKPEEHETLATGYQKQAKNRLGSAVAVMQATDLSSLSSEQRNWAQQITFGMVMMARVVDHHAAKLAHHEDMIRQLNNRVQDLEKKT